MKVVILPLEPAAAGLVKTLIYTLDFTRPRGEDVTPTMSVQFSNPKDIADAGERIYREKFQKDLEGAHKGKFVAIDVLTGTATLAVEPEEALRKARNDKPKGLFHLINVGSPGAFQVSYSLGNGDPDWLYR